MSSIICPSLVPALAVITGIVLAWPGAAQAEKKHPAEEAGARALESKVATSLQFVNDSFETLKIFRLDEQGQRVLMKTLEAEQATQLQAIRNELVSRIMENQRNLGELMMGETRAALLAKFADVLSPEQKKAWDDRIGQPFLGNVTPSRPARSRVVPATGAEGSPIDPRYVEYFKRVVTKYDRNGDGALTEDEWSSMSRNPAAADADGDKRITVDEYARWQMQRGSQTAVPVPQKPPADKPALKIP